MHVPADNPTTVETTSLPGAIAFGFEPMRALLEHWMALRDGAALPTRGNLDPLNFMGALSRAWIYRRLEDGDFQCELAGEEINTAWRDSIRGKRVSSIVGPDYPYVKARWDFVLDEPAVMYSERRDIGTGRVAERLAVPLADAEGRPRFVMGVSAYRLSRLDDNGEPLRLANHIQVWNAHSLARIPEERLSDLSE